MKTREKISEEELLTILNDELFKHAELKKCSFTSIHRSKPDKTGCNWSVELRSGGAPHYVSAPVTGKIMTDARKRYNLK